MVAAADALLMDGYYARVSLAKLHCYNEQRAGDGEPVHYDGPPLDDEEEMVTMLLSASYLNNCRHAEIIRA